METLAEHSEPLSTVYVFTDNQFLKRCLQNYFENLCYYFKNVSFIYYSDLDSARITGPEIYAVIDLDSYLFAGDTSPLEPFRSIPLLLLTSRKNCNLAAKALTQQADGVWIFDQSTQSLAIALHTLLAGESYLAPPVAKILLKNLHNKAFDSSRFDTTLRSEGFTPRELEVGLLLANGLSNRKIAKQIGISERTVKFHVKNLFKKTHAESRTQAALAIARMAGSEPTPPSDTDL